MQNSLKVASPKSDICRAVPSLDANKPMDGILQKSLPIEIKRLDLLERSQSETITLGYSLFSEFIDPETVRAKD